jgi:hypothetical protein
MAERQYRTVASEAQKQPAETSEPVRAPSRESDVNTPFAQAVITAALVTLLVGLLAWALELPLTDRWWAVLCGVSFLVTALLTWRWRIQVADESLYRTETELGQDLNGDGRIGAHPLVTNIKKQNVAGDEAARFEKFIAQCYSATDFRSMKAAGFRDQDEIVEWRALLVYNGMARRIGGGRWEMVKPQAEVVKWAREHVQWIPDRGGRRSHPLPH